jgi:hypothetical protein
VSTPSQPFVLAAVALLAVVLGALAGVPVASTPSASAQQSGATGTIRGRVIAGTAGATIEDGLTVLLVDLAAGGVTLVSQTTIEGGRYSFEVPADGRIDYVALITYEDMPYFSEPVILTAEEREASRDFTLYETTHQRPELLISLTSATVLAIDRRLGQLVIVREDVVMNPSDRVYVGDDNGVTLAIPVLDGTIEAEGEDAVVGEYRHDGGVMLAAIPLRPGRNLLRTEYVVAYDLRTDNYRVRLTAPVPAEAMEARVPTRFVRDIRALEDASRGDDVVLTGALEGERLLLVERNEPARAGEALLAELVGLSGKRASLPLTERTGAIIGTLVALLVLGGAAAFAISRDREPLADATDEDGAS